MKEIPLFRTSRSARWSSGAGPHWPRCTWLLWSCVAAVGCAPEGTQEELGAVQVDRGRPVMMQSPVSSGASGKLADQPVLGTVTAGTAAPAVPSSTSNPMVPVQVQPATPVGGAAAVPPKPQDMAPVMAKPPAAGAAGAPVAGTMAPPTAQPNVPTEPGATTPPEKPAESAGPGMLTVAFMSVGAGGRYAPRNCGAVWIEDSSGKFVKTIERWTAIRERYLEKWSMASGGWGFARSGGTNPDQVDVVSAGTLNRHQMHMATWNMKGRDGMVVPDGKYTVVVEVSEGTSGVGRVEFVKGPMAQMVKGQSSVFSNMTVTYNR